MMINKWWLIGCCIIQAYGYKAIPLAEKYAYAQQYLDRCIAQLQGPHIRMFQTPGTIGEANAWNIHATWADNSIEKIILISQDMLELLTPEKTHAMVAHEYGHVLLETVECKNSAALKCQSIKRGFMALATGIALLWYKRTRTDTLLDTIFCFNAATTFYTSDNFFNIAINNHLETLSRTHEFEADRIALHCTKPEILARAIRKLNNYNGVGDDLETSTHPSLNQRIANMNNG